MKVTGVTFYCHGPRLTYKLFIKIFDDSYVGTMIYKMVFLILIKKGGLLQLKFGGVGVNIYLWAR